ncbi:MAG: GIY-YIG nuclease family protein [Deltaproteobacteria bacterium]|nr:GIY-YIG nuclease family protein [Deltaproteobacteria bacterium]
MKGSYVLLTELEQAAQVEVGSLGLLQLQPGCYAYVGSAMSGLNSRIPRHLRSNKKHFWHIDYLLDHAQVLAVVSVPTCQRLECQIAGLLAEKLLPIPHFGCSDCSCQSHLFYAHGLDEMHSVVSDVISVLPATGHFVEFEPDCQK